MKTLRLSVVARACVLGLLLLPLACAGAEDDRPPAPSSVSNTDTDTDTDNTPPRERPSRRECESGTVKECTIYLPAHGSVQPCYPGLSVCDDSRWSDCLSTEDAEDMLESMDDEKHWGDAG